MSILWPLVLLLIPIGTRVFFSSVLAVLPEYSGFFLYASDLALIILIGYLLRNASKGSFLPRGLTIKGFLAIALLSVFFSSAPGLSLYHFIRLALLVMFAAIAAHFAADKKVFKITLLIFALLATVQALLGIYQFSVGHDAGLQSLGESPLATTAPGVGKITLAGAQFIRSYGTFPHPNIFAAFLTLGLISLAYLYYESDRSLYRFNWRRSVRKNFSRFIRSRFFIIRLGLAAGIFLSVFALALTFSRSGWACALLTLVLMLLLLVRTQPRATGRLVAVLLVSCFATIIILAPFLSARVSAPLAGSSALTERILYNGIGIFLVANHPLGVGIGSQTLFTLQSGLFHGLGLTAPWQWQPIHNLYLLMAAEIGIFGLLCFVIFCITLIVQALKKRMTSERAVCLVMFLGLLAFGLFDHFLWDIWSGRLMLWLSIGLLLSQVSTAKQKLAPAKGG